MSLLNLKENDQRTRFSKDSIIETLSENANLLLDQNLIHDLLNTEVARKKEPVLLNVEKENAKCVLEPIAEVDSSILFSENPSNKHPRYSLSAFDESIKQKNTLSDHIANVSPYCQVLLLELKTERQKCKDFETDLNLAKASLSESKCVIEMLRQRDDQKSKQIDDSNRNLKTIMEKCKSSYNIVSKDLERSQKQNKDLYSKCNTLQNEIKEYKIVIENLKEKVNGCMDSQRNATTANEKYENTLKENRKINDNFQEIKEKFNYCQIETVKQNEEIMALKYTINNLEGNLKDATCSNTCMEVEVQQLKERHSIVIKRALDVDDQIKHSVTENIHLHTEVKDLKSSKDLLRKELHDFYKRELQTALTQSSVNMQSRINDLEAELNEKTTNNNNKTAELRKFYEGNIKSMSDKYSASLSSLSKKVASLQEENVDLHNQRKAIVRALGTRGSMEAPSVPLITHSWGMSHIDMELYKEDQLYKNYDLPVLDKPSSFQVPPVKRPSSNPESLRRNNFVSHKVIASTSLSSIRAGSSSDDSCRQKVDAGQSKLRQRRKQPRAGVVTGARNPHAKIYTASEIVDSFDTEVYSSNKEFNAKRIMLQNIEAEISKLESEASMMSSKADSSVDDSFKNFQSLNRY